MFEQKSLFGLGRLNTRQCELVGFESDFRVRGHIQPWLRRRETWVTRVGQKLARRFEEELVWFEVVLGVQVLEDQARGTSLSRQPDNSVDPPPLRINPWFIVKTLPGEVWGRPP